MATLKSWGEVQSSPQYQQADNDTRMKIYQGYQAEAAKQQQSAAPDQPSDNSPERSIAQGAANFGEGALETVGTNIAQGAGGLLEMADTAANKAIGMGPSILSTYGKRMQEHAQQERADTMARTGTAGKIGGLVGQTAFDIATIPTGVGLATQAGLAAGNAYSNQSPEDKSALRALTVGGANLVANKLLPGTTGDVAEGLLKNGFTEAAKRVGKKAAEGAVAGAKGGAIVGVADEENANPNASGVDLLAAGIKGAEHGGAFGATFGATHGTIGEIGNKISKAGGGTIDIASASDSPDVAARQAQVIRGSKILADYDIPLKDSRLGDEPAAQQVFGKSQSDVEASRNVSNVRQTNQSIPFVTGSEAAGKMNVTYNQMEKGAKQLAGNMNQSLEDSQKNLANMSRSITEMNRLEADQATPERTAATNQATALFDTFKNKFGDYKAAMDKVAGRKEAGGEEGSISREALMSRAQEVQDAYNKLPDTFKTEFDNQFKTPKGFDEGFNPVSQAQDFHEAISQLSNQHPNWRGRTEPSQSAEMRLNITNPLAATKDIGKMAFSGLARRKNLAEQAQNLETTTRLAAGQSARDVANAKANMEEPPVNDGTQEQLEYSNEQPVIPEATNPERSGPDDLARIQANVERIRQQKAAQEIPQETPPEPAPEPQPAPSPDQVVVGTPKAPVTPEPIPEAPAPRQLTSAELAGARERINKIREQQQPAQEAPQETPQEAPQEPQKPNPDQGIVRSPKAPEKAPEAVQEAPVAAPDTRPSKDAGFEEKIRYDRDVKQVENMRKKIHSPEVKNRITVEALRSGKLNMSNLRAEDAASNVEEIRSHVENVFKRRAIRNDITDKKNRGELDAWAKDNNISEKNLAEAIGNKDQVLVTAGIRQKARRLQELEDAKNLPPEEQGDVNSAHSQRAEVMRRVGEMTSPANKELISKVEDEFNPRIAAGNKPMTPTSFQNFLVRMHKQEAEINRKEGLKQAAAEAETKAKAAAQEAQQNAPTVAKQRDATLAEVDKMSPEAQEAVRPLVTRKFHSLDKAGKVMTDAELTNFRESLFRTEYDANEKAGKQAEMRKAEAKLSESQAQAERDQKRETLLKERANKNAERNKRKVQQFELDNQISGIESRVRQELNDSGLTEHEIDSVVSSHMHNEAYGSLKEPMTPNQEQRAFKQATKFGQDHKALVEKGNEAAREAHLSAAANKELQAQLAETQQKLDELSARMATTEKGTKEEQAERNTVAAEDVIGKAETAFKRSSFTESEQELSELEAAAKVLKEVYFQGDDAKAHSVTMFPKLLRKALDYKRQYPNHPELWLSHSDVDNIAKTGYGSAGNLKQRLTDAVLGKRYKDVDLLSGADREKLAKMVDQNPNVHVDLTSMKGRGALLSEVTTTNNKPKVTVRRKGKAGIWNKRK